MYERVNIKSVIIVTALAAVISVTAGGIGGVSPGTLIIRALIASLLFGLGTVIVNIVVDSFLPELRSGGMTVDSDVGPEVTAERGQNVNIVMDDEDTGSIASSGEISVSDSEPVEGADDLDSSSGIQNVSGEFRPTGNADLAGVDKNLPDIGVFASTFGDNEEDGPDEALNTINVTESSEAESVRSRFSAMQTNDVDKKEFFQNNTTAEELAKGVRTMLKSDEKG